MFRVDKWYAIYKYADLGTVEAENMKYGQSDGNLWDMIEFRKNKFIPKIQIIASDKGWYAVCLKTVDPITTLTLLALIIIRPRFLIKVLIAIKS